MPIKPGDAVLAGDTNETRSAADGIAAGDAVLIDANGDMDVADSEAGDLAGVAIHDGDNDGRGNALGLSGVYVIAADAGVSEGDRVNAGNTTGGTTGVVITESGGPGLALSDAGGTWHGDGVNALDVPAGYAVVKL